jgi:hypothetical protein
MTEIIGITLGLAGIAILCTASFLAGYNMGLRDERHSWENP